MALREQSSKKYLQSHVLLQVLELMVGNSVHRVYVVQEQQPATPQSSITPTDIMQMLVLLHT